MQHLAPINDSGFTDQNYSITVTATVTSQDSGPTNSSDLQDEKDVPFDLIWLSKTCVFILIILVAILSNLLVIASVFLYRKLRGINNYFLLSLAFADLFVACFAMTFNASQQILGRYFLQINQAVGEKVQLNDII